MSRIDRLTDGLMYVLTNMLVRPLRQFIAAQDKLKMYVQTLQGLYKYGNRQFA